ncbi:hypothetical protein BDV96DRAFT_593009 [Lophiotrema nucula]|uniref:Uncharacterized protein n=1 Tax=Lophiotrema nucula TaxID=690887 RepID=A0A6A5ZRX7_9PLEO|nr:hypothetical protein BDV96DRAFT_593009 [Lophiotrema nucula]
MTQDQQTRRYGGTVKCPSDPFRTPLKETSNDVNQHMKIVRAYSTIIWFGASGVNLNNFEFSMAISNVPLHTQAFIEISDYRPNPTRGLWSKKGTCISISDNWIGRAREQLKNDYIRGHAETCQIEKLPRAELCEFVDAIRRRHAMQPRNWDGLFGPNAKFPMPKDGAYEDGYQLYLRTMGTEDQRSFNMEGIGGHGLLERAMQDLDLTQQDQSLASTPRIAWVIDETGPQVEICQRCGLTVSSGASHVSSYTRLNTCVLTTGDDHSARTGNECPPEESAADDFGTYNTTSHSEQLLKAKAIYEQYYKEIQTEQHEVFKVERDVRHLERVIRGSTKIATGTLIGDYDVYSIDYLGTFATQTLPKLNELRNQVWRAVIFHCSPEVWPLAWGSPLEDSDCAIILHLPHLSTPILCGFKRPLIGHVDSIIAQGTIRYPDKARKRQPIEIGITVLRRELIKMEIETQALGANLNATLTLFMVLNPSRTAHTFRVGSSKSYVLQDLEEPWHLRVERIYPEYLYALHVEVTKWNRCQAAAERLYSRPSIGSRIPLGKLEGIWHLISVHGIKPSIAAQGPDHIYSDWSWGHMGIEYRTIHSCVSTIWICQDRQVKFVFTPPANASVYRQSLWAAHLRGNKRFATDRIYLTPIGPNLLKLKVFIPKKKRGQLPSSIACYAVRKQEGEQARPLDEDYNFSGSEQSDEYDSDWDDSDEGDSNERIERFWKRRFRDEDESSKSDSGEGDSKKRIERQWRRRFSRRQLLQQPREEHEDPYSWACTLAGRQLSSKNFAPPAKRKLNP